jgi:hypothetical protein
MFKVISINNGLLKILDERRINKPEILEFYIDNQINNYIYFDISQNDVFISKMPGLNKNNPFNREVKLIFTISQGEIK